MIVGTVSVVVLLAAVQLYFDGVISATAFGCKNELISDAWRDMVLTLHNDFRRKLAKGTVQGKNARLPVGKNIKQLYWDCALEADAQGKAITCPQTAPTIGNYGIAFEEIKTKAACNASDVISEKLNTWWKEGAKKQTDQTKVQGNDIFSQMAYFESDSFACTYHPCSNSKMSFLCVYSKDGKGNGGNLYSSGGADTAQLCAECANTCEAGLCNVAPAALLPTGTMCQNKPNTKDLMTDDLRNQALNMHNYYRRVLASGWAKDAKLTYAKPSQAMPALTQYDCDLEDTIMTHIKDCVGTAASTNKAKNFIAFDDYKSPREDVLQKEGFAYDTGLEWLLKVIQQWWSPLETLGNADNTYTQANEATLKTYINMAHHKATKVGCGVQTCPRLGKTLVQCAYEGVPYVPTLLC
ncbi:hypothetical protein Y032_0183g962 [Ancylostoma ceylanicum]|uniref:SCP domain-containing protein n=1 Tax=Ancylostoma ceylanicum TaxID=53326 RepID=A0A016SSL4_9BILA|nr:hypothetical protein Y032_0183g962 [Ancylostoma ceylanicum]